MKAIRLSAIFRNKNLYCCWLGNGHKHNFKNKQEAEAFLSDTSKFLNKKLFDLNECWKWLFITYQDKQFYFSHGAGINKAFTGSNTDAKNIIIALIDQFDRTITNSRHENGLHNSFVGLMRIANYQQQLIRIIKAVTEKRSDTQAKYMCESWFERLNTITNELKDYSSHTSAEYSQEILLQEPDARIIILNKTA